jgi:hypothetical protein
MSLKSDVSRITVDIPKNFHKKLKALAALEGKSMREIIVESLEGRLSPHQPNKKTVDALAAIEKGKGLKKAKDFQDLLKQLNIK